MSTPSKSRRWQIGESAVCSCPEWGEPEVCLVIGGALAGNRPSVERGGGAHACPTATLAPAKIGRPRGDADGGQLARVDPQLVEEMRRVIRAKGVDERPFLEGLIADGLRRFE